mmetsp:Transcript_7901/g.20402  ORF Transcript_7901/g.20402 Transcript_7901/m.20402 type:complete len:258 (+) Transcript_7901:1975-2748(+)
MAQRKLDELANLCHLLAHATNVVVANVVELFLILAYDGLTLAVDLGVRRDDAILSGIRLDHLELDAAHTATHHEQVALAHGTVRLKEIRLQEGVEQVSRDALDGVLERKHVNTLAVLNVRALVNAYNVAEAHAQVLAHNLVDSDLRLLARLIREHDADGILALFSLQKHGVSAEQLQLLHGLHVQADDGVVVVNRVVDNQAVRALLALENRSREVLLFARILFRRGRSRLFRHGLGTVLACVFSLRVRVRGTCVFSA